MPPDREPDDKSANTSSVLVDQTALADGQEVNMDQRDLTVDKEKQHLRLAHGEGDTGYLSGIKLLLVMASLTVVLVLTMLDISIVGTAIPQITSDFHRLEDVGWYIGSYQLASATIQPLTGKLYTYFSIKWIFLFFFLLFEIGSAVCGAATSSGMLIGGRSIAGAGQSGLLNGSIIIVLAICKPEIRPMYTGIAMGMGQIGVILGPLLGGILTEHASWRWCFYINLPLGAVAGLFLILINIPEQTPKQAPTLPYIRSLLPHFDLSGFALFAVASVMFLLALQFGSSGDYRWNSPTVIGLLCGAVVTAVLFALWERRVGAGAMIPGHMVSQTVVWTSALHFALLMTSVVVGGNFMPIYLQSVKGLTPTMSGVYMLGSIIPQLIFIVISGALVQRLGYYLPWAVGASVITAIGAGIISTWGPSTGLGKLLGYQVLFGARGAGMQMAIIAIQHHLPAKEAAIGNSFVVFCQNFLNAIFITVGNTILQESLAKGVNAYIPGGIISPEDAVAAGGSAAAVRALAPPGPIRDGLLRAYSDSFGDVMYLVVATCVCGSVVALGMGWTDLRVKKEPEGDTSTNTGI